MTATKHQLEEVFYKHAWNLGFIYKLHYISRIIGAKHYVIEDPCDLLRVFNMEYFIIQKITNNVVERPVCFIKNQMVNNARHAITNSIA